MVISFDIDNTLIPYGEAFEVLPDKEVEKKLEGDLLEEARAALIYIQEHRKGD